MQARQRTDLIKNGKVASLDYSRYWAQKQGKAATARHGNMIMAGGSKSLEELIAAPRRASWSPAPGISAWSIRSRCC
jgi:predicted Zn-dependent protease